MKIIVENKLVSVDKTATGLSLVKSLGKLVFKLDKLWIKKYSNLRTYIIVSTIHRPYYYYLNLNEYIKEVT
jgi:hypothetical protein